MKTSAREKLLEAALEVIREQGYAATAVDDLCARAGVTKGAFFHHFATKDALAVAAADHWSEKTSALFAGADYHQPKDPLDRVLAYIEFRKRLIRGDIPDFTCLVGTMVQEAYAKSDAIRDACRRSIEGHAATLEADIAAAIDQYDVHGVTARSLALHTQAVIQGAFVVAKARGEAGPALESLDHLKRYVEMLFARKEAAS